MATPLVRKHRRTGRGSGCNPFTPHRGFAVGLALFWCAVVFQSVWGFGEPAIQASLTPPPPAPKFPVWKYWSAWIFLFASGFRTYKLGMQLEWWHLWRPFELGKLLFSWAVWLVVAALVVAGLVGLFTLIYTA